MSNSAAWSTIESDPGVFSELCDKIGVKGVIFEELYGLDSDTFNDFVSNNNVHGFVFLFKHTGDNHSNDVAGNAPCTLYFAKQVIQDACASMAIMSILMNRPSEIDIGIDLLNFREIAMSLDSETRGMALNELDVLRTAHNSFHSTPSFEIVRSKSGKKEDQFHFISYVPHNNEAWELDGLQEGPIPLSPSSSWYESVRMEIVKRIAKLSENGDELRFTLLALVDDKSKICNVIQKTLDQLSSENSSLDSIQLNSYERSAFDSVLAPFLSGCDVETAKVLLANRCEELAADLINQAELRCQWTKENNRRRHDFVPFALKVLSLLAKKGDLRKMVDAARVNIARKQ